VDLCFTRIASRGQSASNVVWNGLVRVRLCSAPHLTRARQHLRRAQRELLAAFPLDHLTRGGSVIRRAKTDWPDKAPPAYDRTRDGSIWALFMDQAYEGSGFARLLFECACAVLENAGCKRMRLTTAPETRAEKFYSKAGWKVAGVKGDQLVSERFPPFA
jgi:GNAT superfamily N-acetyltransferase